MSSPLLRSAVLALLLPVTACSTAHKERIATHDEKASPAVAGREDDEDERSPAGTLKDFEDRDAWVRIQPARAYPPGPNDEPVVEFDSRDARQAAPSRGRREGPSDATLVFLPNQSHEKFPRVRVLCGRGPGFLVTSYVPLNAAYTWDLPGECFDQPMIRVRFEREGGGLGPLPPGRLELALRFAPRGPDVVRNTHPLEGYFDRLAAAPGDLLALKVHSPHGAFALDILRFGATVETLAHHEAVAGQPQNYTPASYRNGANWRTTQLVPVGHDWKPGLYAARLTDASGAVAHVAFVVRPSVPPAHPKELLVLASTNTWVAYNPWGGASFYHYLIDDRSGRMGDGSGPGVHRLSPLRPNAEADPTRDDSHLAGGEKHVLAWLERQGYAYDMATDADLDEHPGFLRAYRAVVISTHSEYWSARMIEGVREYLAHGGHLVILSGNNMYWKVTLHGDELECHKDGSQHWQTREPGGLWPALGINTATLTGIRYDTKSSYATCAPYRVLEPGHWAFDGTGLRKDDLIGAEGLNRHQCDGGASGWEIDWADPGSSPAPLHVLAKGTNPGGGADMTIYENDKTGAAVFSASSITFGGSLVVDPQLGKIVDNVLKRFLSAAGSR